MLTPAHIVSLGRWEGRHEHPGLYQNKVRESRVPSRVLHLSWEVVSVPLFCY